MNVSIRWMIRRDLAEVVEIERLSFEQRWDEKVFLQVLRQRTCIGIVAEHNHRVVGYAIYELQKNMISVLNFAVHPDFQRKYIGTQIINRIIDKLTQQRRRSIALEVRESNLSAQLFFKQMGFRAMHVLQNYFEDVGEDAFIMVYQLERPESEFAPGLEPRNRISKYIQGKEVEP